MTLQTKNMTGALTSTIIKFRPVSLLPSVGNLVFLGIFLELTCLGNTHSLLGDTDTGYHIRVGELILATHSVPSYDVFSFHSPPLSWTAHEWLSEVIMALVHRGFGLTGIVVFFALIISLTYYLLFTSLRLNHKNILLIVFFVSLVVASSALHWFARPHIFSLLLTLAYSQVLDAYQYRNRSYLWVLPILMILWVNLHGGFIIGFVLIALYLAGNLISSTAATRKPFPLALALAGCFLASLVNPYGYHILLFPLNLVSNEFLMNHITEYLSPNFHSILPFRYLVFLAIALFALSKSPFDVIELALVLLFLHMALYSARYIPLFAIVTSPILMRHAESLIDGSGGKIVKYFKVRSEGIALIDASSNAYLWAIVAGLAVFVAIANGKIQFQFDERVSPRTALEFLRKENLKGNMFNNETFGDSVIYTAWPEYKVFVDGRFDVYGAPRMRDYVNVVFLSPGWQNVLDKYDINFVFETATSPLSVLLMERKDWHLVYADKFANIFVRNTTANRELIRKFPNVKPPAGTRTGSV
jgi:hypothetical protein